MGLFWALALYTLSKPYSREGPFMAVRAEHWRDLYPLFPPPIWKTFVRKLLGRDFSISEANV